ncbi:MAG: hypothetical protein ACYDAE_25125 [Steroidobacteraceae bacterium]
MNWASRYASQQAMLDAAWSAQERIAKGELARPLPDNPTPEQLAEYRKGRGIPEKPEGYWEAAKDVKLEEGDKEIIAPYLPIMHELNLTPAQAAKLIGFRQQEVERQIDERQQADVTLRKQTEDALHQEWGSQYRQNVETMRSFLETRFGDGVDDLMNARTPSGDPLLGNSTVLRSLLQMALDLNGGVPSITLPDGKLADGAGVDSRMHEIEALMKDGSSKYWKGPEAEPMQAEYRRLIEFKERNAARGGAGVRR